MRSLLALTVLALVSGSFAGELNVVGQGAKGRGGGGKPGGGAPGAYPAGVPKDTHWIPFEHLKDIPEAVGSHRIMRVPGPGVGWAVGFPTNSNVPAGEIRSGWFGTAPTPGAITHDACQKHMWISSNVGGGPLPGCYLGPVAGAAPTSMTWRVHGAGSFPKPKYEICVLEQGKRYYAHYTATGWDRNDKDRPTQCDALINNSLSTVPD